MTITRKAPQRATRSTLAHPCRVVSITDARTGRAHLVTDEAMVAGRRAGRYATVCETVVLAASLTAAPNGFCLGCREWARR